MGCTSIYRFLTGDLGHSRSVSGFSYLAGVAHLYILRTESCFCKV